MKLDANKMAISTAMTFAIVWIICSVFVFALPGGMMSMSGDMFHAEFGTMMNWSLNWPGFFVGLVAWSLSTAGIAWLIATFYNWQIR